MADKIEDLEEDSNLESSEVLEIDDLEDRKRKKRNKIIIAVVLIFMMSAYVFRFIN
jgi:hypothetical protein